MIAFVTDWLRLLDAHRRLFGGIVAVCLAAGACVAFLSPKQYRASAQLLPPMANGQTSQLISRLSAITGLENMGQHPGFAALYPDIAQSRGVLEGALAQQHAGRTFRFWIARQDSLTPREHERLLRWLKRRVEGYSNPLTGLITIAVTLKDPVLAAAFTNELLRQMDLFFSTQVVTEAGAKRVSIDARLREVETLLREGEDRLEDFLRANRLPEASPALKLEETRLRRDMEVNAALYVELKRQREIARVEEVGTTPTLRVLEPAVPPLVKVSPRRAIILGFSLVVGGIIGLAAVKLRQDLAAARHAGARDA